MKENLFDVCVPITFYVEVHDLDKPQAYNQTLQPFLQFYSALEENRERVQVIKQQIRDYKKSGGGGLFPGNEEQSNKDKEFLALLNNKTKTQGDAMNTTVTTQVGQGGKGITKFKTFNFERRSTTRYSMPLCHFDGFNLWLLKPTHLNRGRGIHVFRDLETLHKLIREYCQGKDEEVKVAPKKRCGENGEEGSPEAGNEEVEPTGEDNV